MRLVGSDREAELIENDVQRVNEVCVALNDAVDDLLAAFRRQNGYDADLHDRLEDAIKAMAECRSRIIRSQ